jgi:hypothetical protein
LKIYFTETSDIGAGQVKKFKPDSMDLIFAKVKTTPLSEGPILCADDQTA